MEIFVQPDKDKQYQIAKEGVELLKKELAPKIYTVEEKEMGSLKLWTSPDIEKPRHLTPKEKIAREKYDRLLTEKSVHKSTECWMKTLDGCTGTPIAHAREVQFDLKNDRANIDHSHVSTGDYEGPVPGFCMRHIASAPPMLAQAVYFSRAEMYWGLRPKRWFVVFTDGTKQGGSCMEIDPKQESPIVKEEYISVKENE